MTRPTANAPALRSDPEPPRTADVVVVGAGITGASIAHHLALLGVRVAVVEQAPRPAAGATGPSGGMVRAYDTDPVVADLAAASLAVYRDPRRWSAGRSPLRTVGAVTVADPACEQVLRRAAEDLAAACPDTSAHVVADRDEAMGVRLDGGIALVEPDAGWVPPADVTEDWLRRALADGASLHCGVRVLGVEAEGGRPVVRTTAGDVRAGTVIAATGPWTARPPRGLAPRSAVRSRSIQVGIVRRPADTPPHATFIDLRTGVYGKPVDAAHSLVGMPHLVWDAPFDAAPDPAHALATTRAAHPYLPWARDAEQVSVVRAADGYGDGSHLLTRTESPHVWSVRGWNGGGVKTAPEAGRRIAELHVSDELTTRI